MTQQEWLDAFKSQNGREPSLDEFKQAKANGFAMAKPAQSVSPQDELKKWVSEFEKQYNRKPSFDEVKQRRFLGDAKPAQATQPVQPQQPTQATQPVQAQTAPQQPRRQKAAQQAAPAAAPHRNHKKAGKGKKRGIRLLILIIVLLGGGYFFGQSYYSYDSSMDRAATMLNSHSLDKYSKNVVWADNDKTLTGSEAEPLADLMKSSKYDSKSNIKDLLKSNAYGIQLKKTGKKFFVFDDYKVVVRPVTVKVYTDQSGLTVKANGKVLDNDSDSDSVITVKHQAPGLYEFTAAGTSDGDSYKGTDNEQLGDSSTARVYIYTEKSSSSSSSSSKNKLTKDDATSTLQSMASLLSSIGAKNDSDSSSSTTASDVFTDGSDNKAYTDFTEMIKNNKTTSKRTADSINFGSIDVQDVKSTGKKTADATFKMQEDFNYSADTDPDKHTSGTLTQVFLLKAHMKYDKSSDKWLVDSIDSNQQKISETDNTK